MVNNVLTRPAQKGFTTTITTITIIASANMFGQSYLMTQGGPGRQTRTAIYQIAETGLRNYQMGSAVRDPVSFGPRETRLSSKPTQTPAVSEA